MTGRLFKLGLCALLATSVSQLVRAGNDARFAARVQECKDMVMTRTPQFNHLPMAAISLSKHNDGIKWTILWDGDSANGVCIFRNKQLKNLKIKNHLKDYSKHSASDSYKGLYGGFYFDRHLGQWRGPDGLICHTCTPGKGFPSDGG